MFDETIASVSPISTPVLSHRSTRSLYARLPLGKGLLRLSLLSGLVFGSVGCASNDVWIYVDNANDKPMVVTVDGREEATIEPGEFETLKCEPGERRIRVQCGDKVLFDDTKDCQKSDKLGVGRRYFFNPDKRNRYATYTVKYGSSRLDGLTDKLASLADREHQLRYAYQKMAAEVTLLPSSGWFDVPVGAYVLTSPPEYVTTRSGMTERRTVMIRVDRKDYDALEAASKKTDPTEKDLKALEDLVDRVIDSGP